MSVTSVKGSVSKLIIHSNEAILQWVEDTSGTVFVPEGRKCKRGYIYSGILDSRTGKRVDRNKVVSTLSEYLDLLSKHGRKYEYYQIVKEDSFYLIPSHSYTLARFVKVHFPEKYLEMKSPEKVKFNTYKWDFRVWSKTDHLSKKQIIFDIPSEISKILIGPGGKVSKEFYTKTNCSFTIKFNRKTHKCSLILYAVEDLLPKASDIISEMIASAKTTGKVEEIPCLHFPTLDEAMGVATHE